MGTAALASAVTSACRTRVVEVEKLVTVDRPVTKIVTEVVRETVVVPETPRVIERVVTPSPAPTTPIALRADVLDYGWTRLAQQMTSVFQETFPHITVEWRSLSPWQAYPDRIAVLRASGQLGDLIESPSRTLTAAWAEDGVVADLGPAIEADGYDTSGLFPGALASYRWRGSQVGLPLVAHGGEHVLLYDQDLFDEAGAAYPDNTTTLEQLTEAAERIARGRRDVYGLAVCANLPEDYPLLRAFGGELLDPDGTRCLIDEPGGRAFLQWLYDQVHTTGAAPEPRAIERGPTAMWQAGRLAMLCTSLREAVALTVLQPERRIGVLPLPRAAGVAATPALSTGVGYCVPVTSRRAAEALQWIKFMLTREMGVRLFVGGYAEPGSRMASWLDPRVLDWFPHCASLGEAAAQAEGERVPANLATEACYRAWEAHVAPMLAGEVAPDGLSARIAAEVDALLGLSDLPAEEG